MRKTGINRRQFLQTSGLVVTARLLWRYGDAVL
jgi:hypothetical protein